MIVPVVAAFMLRRRYSSADDDDEEVVLTVLLRDRKRCRRIFDDSRLYSARTIRGNVAQAIWTASDVIFAEQVRLTRLQFVHVEDAVREALGAATTRPRVLSPREELLLFLYQMAQCKYDEKFLRSARVDACARHVRYSEFSLFARRHPPASTRSTIWRLACYRTAYNRPRLPSNHSISFSQSCALEYARGASRSRERGGAITSWPAVRCWVHRWNSHPHRSTESTRQDVCMVSQRIPQHRASRYCGSAWEIPQHLRWTLWTCARCTCVCGIPHRQRNLHRRTATKLFEGAICDSGRCCVSAHQLVNNTISHPTYPTAHCVQHHTLISTDGSGACVWEDEVAVVDTAQE
jgi:hypothetical protein